jgi:hypothetical protein
MRRTAHLRGPAALRSRAPQPRRPAHRLRPSASASTSAAPATPSLLPAWRGHRPPTSSLPLLPDGTPDYSSIDSQPQSLVLIAVLRKLLVAEVGADEDKRPWTSFAALLTPVRQVNDRPGSAQEVQAAARRVFQGILPSLALGWVPAAWRSLVKPAAPPALLNGAFYLVFATLFPWLMGPLSGVEHAEVASPASLRPLLAALRLPLVWRVPQGVKAERCRFLEASQCASVCVNSCKAPTQAWLADDFGLDLHIQPNYADFSCTWSFGKRPPPLAEDDALLVPCFSLCGSKEKGAKDAWRQRERLRRGVGVVAGVDTFTGETLEAIAARASEAARREAGLDEAARREAAERARALAEGGKCWSVDEDRALV